MNLFAKRVCGGAGDNFALTAMAMVIAGSFGSGVSLAQETTKAAEDATELEAIEVTGSRLGRADIEGALPLAVINREEIEHSGFTSVGELLRNTTFNSLGAFRAQSGSSAQALVAVDLRGLGSERTLVLIDGRRAPKAPFAPSAQDLNAVPLAVVDRIEILKDGASAIYGSDAIAGVINIITRKNFDGAQVSYQEQGTAREGGDSKGAQFVSGITGDRGNIVFGASYFTRDIIFARNSLYNTRGASFFSNNYTLILPADPNNPQGGEFDDLGADNIRNPNNPDVGEGDYFDDNTGHYYYGAVVGGNPNGGANSTGPGCPNQDPGFYLTGGGGPANLCGYDFNLVAADEAKTANQSIFVRTHYEISKDWNLNVAGSVSRATSFGRYAPSLNDTTILVPANSPNNPFGDQPVLLYHRFAALGTRDNDTDANVYDLSGIFSGTIGSVNVDTGVRSNTYQYYELGRNYVVLPIATQYIIDGTYDIFQPLANPTNVLNSMKATITRDSIWRTLEYFGEANMPLFDMAGGTSKGAVGVEYRTEKYFDAYDSLQESGSIGGSAGNSSGTNRKVKSAYFELFMPVIEKLEISLSGRHESYNDVGNNFAPKLSGRYQPTDSITLRASAGQGFRAPTLDVISALPAFSASAINNDAATCAAANGTFTTGTCSVSSQVSATIISNPELVAEDSNQFSFGFAMDVLSNLDFSIDYYNIAISNRINFISPQTIVTRLATGDPIPAGLGITRSALPAGPGLPGRIIGVIAGSANEGDLDTSGLDVAVNFKQELGGLGRIESHLNVAYILDYKIDTGRDLVGDPAVPQYRVTLANNWKLADMSLALNANHITDQAQRVNATTGVRAGHIPSYTTWDIQAGYNLPWLGGTSLSVGAINLFDREPSNKSAFDGRDYNFNLYDQYGRQPYIKFIQKF